MAKESRWQRNPEKPFSLTLVEKETLRRFAQGKKTREIAQELSCCPKTIRSRIAVIKQKLFAENVEQAIKIALDQNLITRHNPPQPHHKPLRLKKKQ